MSEYELDKSSKNEKGKPLYPKLVTSKDGQRVRVFNIKHELEVTGKQEKKEKKEETKKPDNSGWQ